MDKLTEGLKDGQILVSAVYREDAGKIFVTFDTKEEGIGLKIPCTEAQGNIVNYIFKCNIFKGEAITDAEL